MMHREEERTGGEIPLAFDPVIPAWDAVKKWWLVVLAALTAGMLAFACQSGTHVPQYTAQCTLAVYSADGEGTVAGRVELAKAFAEVVGSPVIGGVEGLQPERFGGTIRAAVLEKTNLVTVYVTADDPRQALETMELLLAAHGPVTESVTGGIVLEVLEPAAMPERPINPVDPVSAFVKAAAAAGGAVFALLVVLSWFRDTVRSPAEAMEKLTCPYLGTLRRGKGSRRDAELGKLCRRVRTAMGGGTLVVTSPDSRDGADMVAAGLAEKQKDGNTAHDVVMALPLTEAMESLDRADAVLLVLRHNRTSVPALNAAASALERAGARLLGCVCVEGWSTGLLDGEARAGAWYRRNREVER